MPIASGAGTALILLIGGLSDQGAETALLRPHQPATPVPKSIIGPRRVCAVCAVDPLIQTSIIPDTKPSITELEIRHAAEAAAHGWGAHGHDDIHRFEDAFKAHLGAAYAIATSSGTGALHLGLAALGIGPGDVVIRADTNGIATAALIVHLGASPVFVDIRPDTWCIDPDRAAPDGYLTRVSR